MESIVRRLTEELSASSAQVLAAVNLLDEGATVPFIARYRKEVTGGLDDVALRTLETQYDTRLNWREIQGADSMELLELVDSGQAELAVIDSNEFAVQQSLYPRLKVAFDLGAEQDMVWYLSPEVENARLKDRIDEFFARLLKDVGADLDGTL